MLFPFPFSLFPFSKQKIDRAKARRTKITGVHNAEGCLFLEETYREKILLKKKEREKTKACTHHQWRFQQ